MAKTTAVCLVFFLLAGTCFLFLDTRSRMLRPEAENVSAAEADMARSAWRNGLAAGSPAVPYAAALAPVDQQDPDAELAARVNAKSAILVDATTGSVVFEKNADEVIPPASMTKLVAMYTAFHAAANGEITFDDTVDLPPESWAKNIPAGSSLMFLGEGQRVTVRELLSGMAVVSGNDAAIALACHVSGSVDAFVGRMNGEMERLGLESTRFVEPSGLSERNSTTAREFAGFARVYVDEYPEALKAFHARTELAYPMSWNLPEGSREAPVLQQATNRLLGVVEGCDGLKTGFINESGYNLTLTAERNGTRFLSVTMGGPGNGSLEGNRLRNDDGTALMEWAFGRYVTVRPEPAAPAAIPVFGGTVRAIRAIPAAGESFTALKNVMFEGETEMHPVATAILPSWLEAPVEAGDVVGSVEYRIGEKLVHTVPLIADRHSGKAGIAARAVGRIAILFARLVK